MKDKFTSIVSVYKKSLAFVAIFLVAIAISATVLLQQQRTTIKQLALAPMCNDTGVTKNANGTYTFARLSVDAQGSIVDANNPTCIVHLLGLNMGALFLGSAAHASLAEITQLKSLIPMNVVRENINTYWWNTNVMVPDQNMGFQQWLKTVISWNEQNGNYVIIDIGPQFHNPPCGAGVSVPCPRQNQASLNVPQDPTEQITYEPVPLQAISDLSKLYANDPAVMFNIWNEPTPGTTSSINEATYMQYTNDRINAVRQNDPNAIVMVFERSLNDIMGTGTGGTFPNFTQGNIMFDSHIYGTGWVQSQTAAKVAYAHSHGEAYIIGEWGAKAGQPDPATMTAFLSQNNVQSTYFSTGDLITGNAQSAGSLNSIGQGVAAGYQSIFGAPQPTSNTTPPLFTSVTPNPSGGISPTATITKPGDHHPTERQNKDSHHTDGGGGK